MTDIGTEVANNNAELAQLRLLIASERGLHKWVYASFATIVMTAIGWGVAYGKMVQQVGALSQRVEEIRSEGSIPLQQLNTQLRVMAEQQRQNNDRVEQLTSLVMKNEAALIRIESRLR